MKLIRLFLAVLVLSAVPAMASPELERPVLHFGFLQPMFRHGGKPEILLADVSFCFLHVGRFTGVGPGVGLATVEGVGGLSLSLSLLNYRIAKFGKGAGDSYIGVKLIRDHRTDFTGFAAGFSIGW